MSQLWGPPEWLEAKSLDDSDGLAPIHEFLKLMRNHHLFDSEAQLALAWAICEFEKYPKLPAKGSLELSCSTSDLEVQFVLSPEEMCFCLTSDGNHLWSFKLADRRYYEDDEGLDNYTLILNIGPKSIIECELEALDISPSPRIEARFKVQRK